MFCFFPIKWLFTGTFLVLGIVVRKYGIDDALIGTVATIGKFLSQFVFAFATTEAMFYSG